MQLSSVSQLDQFGSGGERGQEGGQGLEKDENGGANWEVSPDVFFECPAVVGQMSHNKNQSEKWIKMGVPHGNSIKQ